MAVKKIKLVYRQFQNQKGEFLTCNCNRHIFFLFYSTYKYSTWMFVITIFRQLSRAYFYFTGKNTTAKLISFKLQHNFLVVKIQKPNPLNTMKSLFLLLGFINFLSLPVKRRHSQWQWVMRSLKKNQWHQRFRSSTFDAERFWCQTKLRVFAARLWSAEGLPCARLERSEDRERFSASDGGLPRQPLRPSPEDHEVQMDGLGPVSVWSENWNVWDECKCFSESWS